MNDSAKSRILENHCNAASLILRTDFLNDHDVYAVKKHFAGGKTFCPVGLNQRMIERFVLTFRSRIRQRCPGSHHAST